MARRRDPRLRHGCAGCLHPVRPRGGEFALDCLTGSIHGACHGDAVEFGWDGNDEMEQASGQGWAEIQDDGSLEGEICLENGNDIPFIARRTTTSSTAC
jgi:hypothetical protein